jgi:putative transcriptional regulator
MTRRNTSRLRQAIEEMADDQRRLGLIDDAGYRKLTLGQLGRADLPGDRPISGDEIREIRERANMSQGAFARHLRTTTGFVSKLERGETNASGPTLALLNVIRRKGIEALS